MKCFTWNQGQISEGISLSNCGSIVLGGDEGRYRKKVRLSSENPPEVRDGLIYEAHPIKAVARLVNKELYMLAKPCDSPEKRCLVLITTKWVYTRNTTGTWKPIKGSPKDLAVGHGFHGSIKTAMWTDGLVMMSPGDVLRITPEGGYKTERYALFYENGVQSALFDDYIATTVTPEDCQKL